MKCYKVLYRDYKGRLLSIGEAFNHPSELIIEYIPDKLIRAPEGTGLFVFNTLDYATFFASTVHSNHGENVEIWEVDAEHVEYIKRVAYITAYKLYQKDLKHAIRNHWQCSRFAQSNIQSDTVPAPIGTLACESVILKRKVR